MQSSGEVVKVKKTDLFPIASSSEKGLMPASFARRYENYVYLNNVASDTHVYYISDIQITHNKCGFLELEVMRYAAYNKFKILISATYNFGSEAIYAIREDLGDISFIKTEVWAKKVANGKWAIYLKFTGGQDVPVLSARLSSENLIYETSYRNNRVTDLTGLQKVV